MTAEGRRFQVALSFPGEQRAFISQVADCLSQSLGRERVFYDQYYEAELARPNLHLYLGKVYRHDSELLVPFYSADYERKKWCRLEWRQMSDILFSLDEHRIMPFRFDDTPIPGVLSIDGYVTIGKRKPREIAELILERLRTLGSSDDATAGHIGDSAVSASGTLGGLLLTNTREAPKATNPATLLNARYEVVPFYHAARATELADLKTWCDAEKPSTGVRLFYGPGGTGKTRLLIEWSKQLRDEGWHAGFLPEEADADQVEAILYADQPTLVAVDYAECRPGLHELLKRIANRPDEQTQRLRIVLLARDVGDWWQSLCERDEAVRHLLMQWEPTSIAPVPLEGPLRNDVWAHARNAFAAHLDKTVAPTPDALDDEHFGRVLYLHMSALAAVEGLPADAGSLVDEIVVHEKHFWTRHYEKQFADNDEATDFRRRCGRFVAAVTLRGGVSSREAAEELNRRVEGPAPKYPHLVPFVRSLYAGRGRTGEDSYLAGLEPDLLGEELIWSVLTDPNTNAAKFLDQTFRDAPETAMRNGFTVLGRISLQDPTVAGAWLAGMLEADIAGRAASAFQAALALGTHTAFSPLGSILADALQKEGNVDHAIEFYPLVPRQTVSLREVAAWTAKRLLDFLSAQDVTEENLRGRAGLLNNLGNRLGDLGRREEALQAAREAVEIRRQLARDRPDGFLPYLASSLNNLGNRLSDLGRREEALQAAQEAVDIRRQLAKKRPDTFLPYLAMSLTNLGNRLGDLGRREEALQAAQEAVDIRRPLAKNRPDAFLPDLAGSLINLSGRLRELGRREEAFQAAREAVDIYRRLARDRPDACLPHLAASLNNLGNRLSDLGRREEALQAAQEALDIHRRLAKDRPDAFLPDLARNLSNLGLSLSDLGRPEEALRAAQEALDIHRQLAKDRPHVFLPDLARSMGVLGSCLADAGRLSEAADASTEGIRTLAPAFHGLPQAFAGLMGDLVSEYLRQTKEAGKTPDMDLLGPIQAKLDEIDHSGQ